jgi:hypothetical protein
MTEVEWLACEDPLPMIRGLSHSVWGERRGRLFAVACCRLLRALPDRYPLAAVIEAAERFADKRADDNELAAASRIANDAVEWEARHDMSSWQYSAAEVVAAAVRYPTEEYRAIDELFAWARTDQGTTPDLRTGEDRSGPTLANLVREFVGNPFRPVVFAPEWGTRTVVTLATQVYESRDFGAMPILADALQDAGCDSDDLLNHCRDEKQPHVRGCWVVDLVLGKQ